MGVVALLVVLLSGCPVYQLNTLPETGALPHPIALGQPGPYHHVQSDLVFPVSLAEFERIALMQFDTAGLDVSGTYRGGSIYCPVHATVYVYPAPRLQILGTSADTVRSIETHWIESEYARSRTELLDRYPDAQPQSEVSIDLRPGLSLRGIFEHGVFGEELEVRLVDRQWFLKFRHTYSSSCARTAREALDAFHAALR